MKLTGAEILTRSLVREGVTTVFGDPGGAILHTYGALRDSPIQHIRCRHEQNAIHAAEGYYKTTGRPGTAMTTSGHGVTNMVTGITDALLDSMAVVVLTSQVPVMVMGRDALQEADLVGTTRVCTKQSFLALKTEEIPRIVRETYYIARSGRPGPVLVDLPKEVLMGRAEFKGHPKEVSIRGYKPQLQGHPGQIKKAVQLIAEARRPVIYGGGGIIHADASEEFRELVDLTQIPTTLTLMGLGALPTAHPRWLGMVGMHGTYWANMGMLHCDLMVAVGSRFDGRVTGRLSEFGKQCKIIHIDIDSTSIGKHVKTDVPIVGDVRHVLGELNGELRKVERDWAKDFEEWYSAIDEWKRRHPLRYEQREGVIKPQYAIDMILRLTEEYDPIIATGVGQHQMWAGQFYRARKPRHWLTSGGLGTMGYGFPAALGAQVAFPDKLVIDIDGDVSFQMTSQELMTCVQYNLPVKVFVINNKGGGMCRQWRRLFAGDQSSLAEGDFQTDFVKLAEASRVTGIRIERPEEVKAGIEKAINTSGPVVVDVVVDREENCFPMIPPGAAMRDIIDAGDPVPAQLSQGWR